MKLNNFLYPLILGLVLCTGCDFPDIDLKLGTMKHGDQTYTTGITKNPMVLKVSKTGEPLEYYIQNGVLYNDMNSIQRGIPSCSIKVHEMDLSNSINRAGTQAMIETGKLNYVTVIAENRRHCGHNDITLSRLGNIFILKLLFPYYIPGDRVNCTLKGITPHYGNAYVRSHLKCSRNIPGMDDTESMTFGEVIDIFKFTYVFVAPEV